MKTNEEMNTMKKDAEFLNQKIHALNEDESAQVTGGGRRQDCFKTKMVCPCGYWTILGGNYVGKVIKCKQCGQQTLKGESPL